MHPIKTLVLTGALICTFDAFQCEPMRDGCGECGYREPMTLRTARTDTTPVQSFITPGKFSRNCVKLATPLICMTARVNRKACGDSRPGLDHSGVMFRDMFRIQKAWTTTHAIRDNTTTPIIESGTDQVNASQTVGTM